MQLLESALARPQQTYAYGGEETDLVDLVDLAASLAFGIARNHPFADGNKLTAFVSCRLFLKLNRADLIASQEEKFKNFLALAEGQISEQEFASWLRMRIQLPEQDGIQESFAKYGS